MDKKYCVYIHTFPNSKKYIGITSKKPNARWQNGKGYKKSKQLLMYNAIQKYGWNNVTSEIFKENLTLKEAQELEKYLISKYSTNGHLENSKGYNLTDGGENISNANYRSIICDNKEYKSITSFCSENNIYKSNGIEDTYKVIRWIKGERGMPKEWYDKNLRYKDMPYNAKCTNKHNTSSIVYDSKEFNSVKECATFLGVKRSTLSMWLNGSNSPPSHIAEKGLQYKNTEYRTATLVQKKGEYPQPKQVFAYGKIYTSMTSLAKELGVSPQNLSRWLNGIRKIPEQHKGNIYYI